jgi:hypothetical protein
MGLFKKIISIENIKIPKRLPMTGFDIPVLASFTGIGALKILCLSHNSLNPKFKITNSGIEYKVVFSKKKPYLSIRQVDFFDALMTKNLTFIFKDSIFSLGINLNNKNNIKQLLCFLKKKRIPLSERAQAASRA